MRRLAAVAVLSVLAPLPAFAADPPQELVIENHRFAPADLHVKAGAPLAIHVVNRDATPEELDSDALKVEKVVPGHGQATVHVRPLPPGTYPFAGEYHDATAQGRVVAE